MTNGLINYWDFDNDFSDKIGKMNLFNVVNIAFVNDRYGKPNSAVFLNNGRMQAPSGLYFSGPLTLTFWIYFMRNVSNYVISFSGDSNYPSLHLFFSSSGAYHNGITTNGVCPCDLYPLQPTPFVWTHTALSIDGFHFRAFYNGTLSKRKNCTGVMTNSLKYSNYIGNPGFFIMDELKFFNRVLNATEIQDDMKSF